MRGCKLRSTDAFGDAELLNTVSHFPFAGVDAELPEGERFCREVARTYRAWLGAHPTKVGSHAVFLLMPAVPIGLQRADRKVAYALDDGETDVTHGMWFVGPAVMSGTQLAGSATFDDIFPEVIAAGAGDVPAVTYRNTTAGPVLRYYPQGLTDPDNRIRIDIAEQSVDLALILAEVDRVHRGVLITPPAHAGGAKLWATPSKRYPVRQVEIAIQSYVRAGLSIALPHCRINAEQNLDAGRLDLEVEQLTRKPGTFVRHAILELKVLRSFGSTGTPTSAAATEKWVSDGVDQAYAYREERGALRSALCCFDMRVELGDPECLEKIEAKAKATAVEVRSWPIYADLKQYRAAAVSAVF